MKFQRWTLEIKIFRINRESQNDLKGMLPFPCIEKEIDCYVVNSFKDW